MIPALRSIPQRRPEHPVTPLFTSLYQEEKPRIL